MTAGEEPRIAEQRRRESAQRTSAGATLRKYLDAIAASAQLVTRPGKTPLYAWGQFLSDSSGDNTQQCGLHGTAHAVSSLAVGIAVLGPGTRYERYMSGGKDWLVERVTTPKQDSDQRKTLKVAEHLASLSISHAAADTLGDVARQLRTDKPEALRGWSFDLTQRNEAGRALVPTTYVARACALAAIEGVLDEGVVKSVFDACLALLDAESDPIVALACAAGLTDVAEFLAARVPAMGADTQLSTRLGALWSLDLALERVHAVQYRVSSQRNGQEHAYCELPVGLAQLRAMLWVQQRGQLASSLGQVLARLRGDLAVTVLAADRLAFQALRASSLVIQMLAEYDGPLALESYISPDAAAQDLVATAVPGDLREITGADRAVAEETLQRVRQVHGELTGYVRQYWPDHAHLVGGDDFLNSIVDERVTDVQGPIFPYLERSWRFGLRLLSALARLRERVGPTNWEECLCLLFLHEAYHTGQQLTAYQYVNVGRGGFVLEGVDYDADVLSVMGALEWGRARRAAGDVLVCETLTGVLRNLLDSLVAFDESTGSWPPGQILERRLRRYLIWMLQYSRVRASPGRPISEVGLRRRMSVEVAGLPVRLLERSGAAPRLVQLRDVSAGTADLELFVYDGDRLYRHRGDWIAEMLVGFHAGDWDTVFEKFTNFLGQHLELTGRPHVQGRTTF